MNFYSVLAPEFKAYGRILNGYDTAKLDEALAELPMPEAGIAYTASEKRLEELELFDELRAHTFGGMPIQMGSCCGKNNKLNCLEYHRNSELNYFTAPVVLMLGKIEDITDFKYDSSNIRLFSAPKGMLIELYATTLHYCPANTELSGFRAACVLPRGTNTTLEVFEPKRTEDALLLMKNKWLLAHPDAPEAAQGAVVGITGENITL